MDKRVFYANTAIFRVVVGLLLLVILLFVMVFHAHAAGTLYAKPIATGTGNCTSWDDACGLQTALTEANIGDQIWVAAGTYIPTTPSARFATFQLKTGVAIYGGFPADGGDWETRNWVANLTTLSGDIGTLSDSTDNSYHVVTGSGVTATAILDGFTISGGNANNTADPYNSGGGMYNASGHPTLTNVTFSGNSAAYLGGGMYNANSHPTLTNITFSTNSATLFGGGMFNINSSPALTNVTFSGNAADGDSGAGGGMFNDSSSNPALTNATFSGNTADVYGGGMVNSGSHPTLTNVTFTENSAQQGGGMVNESNSTPILINVTFTENPAFLGGGMYNNDSDPTLTNVTFSGNSAVIFGGGMYNESNSTPMLTNAIVWGNTPTLDQINNDSSTPIITYSDIQGGYTGIGNINVDPLLGPLANYGGFTQTHALLPGSPAIDAGDPNELNCPTTDQRGYPRPIDGDDDGTPVCDMGAYEFGSSGDGFALIVEIVGSGAVAKNPEQLKYPLSQVVNLTATANPGWTFSSWGGDANGTTNPLSVTMSRHKSITANFTQDAYTLTVTAIGSGSVIVDPVKTTYHYGDLVTLTATVNSDWTFTGWGGDATGTTNPLTMNIQGNTNVIANFTSIYKLYLPLIVRN